MEPDEIGRLIAASRLAFDVTPDAEVTMETNPETSSRERRERFRAAGVNRISFGVQSFREAELRRLGRLHSAGRARDAVSEARAAGFDNISLDLMMWLPQQSRENWAESVEALIDVSPEHASLYLLELYPNAPLREEMARSGWSLAPDEDAAAMYLWSLERLDAAGYAQYEISNVAKPASVAPQPEILDHGESGSFGCGAHSTQGGARWKNLASIVGICGSRRARRQRRRRRDLTRDERLEDALFMGLRLVDGVNIEDVGTLYGVDVWARYGDRLQPFVEEGLLRRDGPRIRLARTGMLVANEIMSVFV